MSYWALVNENGEVLNVIVCPAFNTEQEGQQYLQNLGLAGTWVETYKDGRRGKYAGIADYWDGTDFVTVTVTHE
jgi:hypothetical protein